MDPSEPSGCFIPAGKTSLGSVSTATTFPSLWHSGSRGALLRQNKSQQEKNREKRGHNSPKRGIRDCPGLWESRKTAEKQEKEQCRPFLPLRPLPPGRCGKAGMWLWSESSREQKLGMQPKEFFRLEEQRRECSGAGMREGAMGDLSFPQKHGKAPDFRGFGDKKKQEKELWSSWIRNFWDGRGNVSLEFPPSDPTWILLRDPLGISSASPHILTGEEFPWDFPGNALRAEFGAIKSQDFTARAKGKGEKLEIRDAPNGNSQILSQRGTFSLNYGKSPPIPHFAWEKEGKVAIPKQEFLNSQIFNSPENPGIYSHKKSSHSTTSAGIPSGIRVLQTEEAPGAASHFSMESPSRNLLYSIDFCSFPVSFFPLKYFWKIFLKGKI